MSPMDRRPTTSLPKRATDQVSAILSATTTPGRTNTFLNQWSKRMIARCPAQVARLVPALLRSSDSAMVVAQKRAERISQVEADHRGITICTRTRDHRSFPMTAFASLQIQWLREASLGAVADAV